MRSITPIVWHLTLVRSPLTLLSSSIPWLIRQRVSWLFLKTINRMELMEEQEEQTETGSFFLVKR
jgi:hypothetical protein